VLHYREMSVSLTFFITHDVMNTIDPESKSRNESIADATAAKDPDNTLFVLVR
jgi:hypothetical protein